MDESPKVLVVNDDPSQLHVASCILAKDGYEIWPCLTVEEALSVLGERGPANLIVTDLYMPKIDGWRFCRLLRSPNFANYNAIPIVVVSATFSGADAEEISAQIGANAFLSAPYEADALRQVARELLRDMAPTRLSTVLIVEHRSAQALLLRSAFEAHGYTVFSASTGAEAQRLFRHECPQIVILDYHLPDMTGDSLLNEMKGPGVSSVVIVTTEDPTPELTLKLMRKGADDYLHKPFAAEYLLDLCAKASRQHALLRVEELLEQRTVELRASEARYRNLFENAGDGIVTYNLDSTVLSVNGGFESLAGISRDELVGKHYHHILTAVSFAAVAEQQRLAQEKKLTSWVHEIELSRSDGCMVPVETHCRFLRGRDGHPAMIMAIHRDISVKKNLERERAEFTAMLTHDIKNPVGLILGCAEMLLDDAFGLDEATARNLYRQIQENGVTLLSLVDNYLDLARIEADRMVLDPGCVDLNQLLTQVVTRYEGEACRRQITINFDRRAVPIVEGDGLALQRVFANLLQNAIKFTPAGGRITIALIENDREVSVAITDTGPGIAREQLPFVFDKFHQLAGAGQRGGLGLGLFIVQKLVTAHSGRVEIESTPREGTCFSVFLPLGKDRQSTDRRDVTRENI